MILQFIILFISAFVAGVLAFTIPQWKEKNFKLILVFAGSYLFSITVLHILPELFGKTDSAYYMGLYVLIGFLLQQVLEFLSAGVEHGHMHHHGGSKKTVWMVMVGLSLHAFLEGTLLTQQPSLSGHHHGSETLLWGIVMHKAPAAFALVAVLANSLSRKWVFILLGLFALASPLGMVSSGMMLSGNLIGSGAMEVMFGLVAGGFLHISTTIFFETSPHHKFHLNRLLISVLAALIAILSEYSL
ncbi:ZIP family metal transporter [Echinicola jeungdonensis]|uniref:ZIP family metal transporter n=1 Tax=Echinicola jeungdonensis TaxID=709343 RepID=A0ABV5J3N8_9BACT|nr:ZIP family metal transporter [Echinicola jeungdonensis]MDN3668880.1 ZIP family metal transporter [Echinicola jeungdonensis]